MRGKPRASPRLFPPFLALLLAAASLPAPASANATSAIAVDFGSIVRPVPAFLFGQNLQAIDSGDHLVKADGSFDRSILSLLNEARVTTLRYPGGTSADYLHWWQALGPRSRRPLQSTGYIDEYYQPVLGPDEFIQISAALRAVPFITANSGTGSAEETAALANFFTVRGYPVTYWEIGNEIYFEGIDENGRVGLPPADYARKVIQYAAAIHKKAPYAKIFAAGVIGPEEQNSFWNSVVLGLAGPYVDGISVHNAYFPLYGFKPDGTVPSDAYLYTAMMGSTQAVERSTKVLEDQLSQLGKQIPIFVTEYDGIFYPNEKVEPAEVTYGRNRTLACALFNASVLHIFMRHQRVFGAHHMALAGSQFGSLVGMDASGATWRNPQFFVHKEYAREAGRLLVKANVTPETGTFNSSPIQLLSGQSAVPMLDAVATRALDRRGFALFVVNRSLVTAVDGRVALDLPADVTGSVTVLTGPSYDAKNSAQEPLQVSPVTSPFAARAGFSYTFPPYSLTVFRWTRP
jgi:alpha-N-arabinofuranosidase